MDFSTRGVFLSGRRRSSLVVRSHVEVYKARSRALHKQARSNGDYSRLGWNCRIYLIHNLFTLRLVAGSSNSSSSRLAFSAAASSRLAYLASSSDCNSSSELDGARRFLVTLLDFTPPAAVDSRACPIRSARTRRSKSRLKVIQISTDSCPEHSASVAKSLRCSSRHFVSFVADPLDNRNGCFKLVKCFSQVFSSEHSHIPHSK